MEATTGSGAPARPGKRWWRRLAVLAVGALGATVAGTVAVTPPLDAATTLGPYVALGDSYVAGPFVPNADLLSGLCLRSDHNYARDAARTLGVSIKDVSCSGATTTAMTTWQYLLTPPQLNALSSSTRIVSLGIGGNDIGFVDILIGCIALSDSGTPCTSKYVVNGVDQLQANINATAPKVAAVLRGIHTRAPNARVFVVGYPDIFPASGSCFSVMPFTTGDVPYLRKTEQSLNTMLAATAAANTATYVDTYTPSIGHDVCSGPANRWVEPFLGANNGFPVHPNSAGMAATANALVAKIRA